MKSFTSLVFSDHYHLFVYDVDINQDIVSISASLYKTCCGEITGGLSQMCFNEENKKEMETFPFSTPSLSF